MKHRPRKLSYHALQARVDRRLAHGLQVSAAYTWSKMIDSTSDGVGGTHHWAMAMEKSQVWGDVIPIGKFFQRTDRPSLDQCEPVLDEGGPLAHRDLHISKETAKEFIAELI